MNAKLTADPVDHIAIVTGEHVSRVVAAVLTCTECGAFLTRGATYYSCPAGHGKLASLNLLTCRVVEAGYVVVDAGDPMKVYRKAKAFVRKATKAAKPTEGVTT